MSLCTHLYLDLVDGSPCTREDHPQDPGGHVYASSRGSEVDDRHREGGHG
jgi:hypothetical protein